MSNSEDHERRDHQRGILGLYVEGLVWAIKGIWKFVKVLAVAGTLYVFALLPIILWLVYWSLGWYTDESWTTVGLVFGGQILWVVVVLAPIFHAVDTVTEECDSDE